MKLKQKKLTKAVFTAALITSLTFNATATTSPNFNQITQVEQTKAEATITEVVAETSIEPTQVKTTLRETPATDWAKTAFSHTGSGTQAEPFVATITTAEQFAYIDTFVNSQADNAYITISVGSTINFATNHFQPLNFTKSSNNVEIVGNNFELQNFIIDTTDASILGNYTGTLENVTILNANISGINTAATLSLSNLTLAKEVKILSSSIVAEKEAYGISASADKYENCKVNNSSILVTDYISTTNTTRIALGFGASNFVTSSNIDEYGIFDSSVLVVYASLGSLVTDPNLKHIVSGITYVNQNNTVLIENVSVVNTDISSQVLINQNAQIDLTNTNLFPNSNGYSGTNVTSSVSGVVVLEGDLSNGYTVKNINISDSLISGNATRNTSNVAGAIVDSSNNFSGYTTASYTDYITAGMPNAATVTKIDVTNSVVFSHSDGTITSDQQKDSRAAGIVLRDGENGFLNVTNVSVSDSTVKATSTAGYVYASGAVINLTNDIKSAGVDTAIVKNTTVDSSYRISISNSVNLLTFSAGIALNDFAYINNSIMEGGSVTSHNQMGDAIAAGVGITDLLMVGYSKSTSTDPTLNHARDVNADEVKPQIFKSTNSAKVLAVTDDANNAWETDTSFASGIGWAENILMCTNSADVTGIVAGGITGGFEFHINTAAYSYPLIVTNCVNTGNIYSNRAQSVNQKITFIGGIVGRYYSLNKTNYQFIVENNVSAGGLYTLSGETQTTGSYTYLGTIYGVVNIIGLNTSNPNDAQYLDEDKFSVKGNKSLIGPNEGDPNYEYFVDNQFVVDSNTTVNAEIDAPYYNHLHTNFGVLYLTGSTTTKSNALKAMYSPTNSATFVQDEHGIGHDANFNITTGYTEDDLNQVPFEGYTNPDWVNYDLPSGSTTPGSSETLNQNVYELTYIHNNETFTEFVTKSGTESEFTFTPQSLSANIDTISQKVIWEYTNPDNSVIQLEVGQTYTIGPDNTSDIVIQPNYKGTLTSHVTYKQFNIDLVENDADVTALKYTYGSGTETNLYTADQTNPSITVSVDNNSAINNIELLANGVTVELKEYTASGDYVFDLSRFTGSSLINSFASGGDLVFEVKVNTFNTYNLTFDEVTSATPYDFAIISNTIDITGDTSSVIRNTQEVVLSTTPKPHYEFVEYQISYNIEDTITGDVQTRSYTSTSAQTTIPSFRDNEEVTNFVVDVIVTAKEYGVKVNYRNAAGSIYDQANLGGLINLPSNTFSITEELNSIYLTHGNPDFRFVEWAFANGTQITTDNDGNIVPFVLTEALLNEYVVDDNIVIDAVFIEQMNFNLSLQFPNTSQSFASLATVSYTDHNNVEQIITNHVNGVYENTIGLTLDQNTKVSVQITVNNKTLLNELSDSAKVNGIYVGNMAQINLVSDTAVHYVFAERPATLTFNTFVTDVSDQTNVLIETTEYHGSTFINTNIVKQTDNLLNLVIDPTKVQFGDAIDFGFNQANLNNFLFRAKSISVFNYNTNSYDTYPANGFIADDNFFNNYVSADGEILVSLAAHKQYDLNIDASSLTDGENTLGTYLVTFNNATDPNSIVIVTDKLSYVVDAGVTATITATPTSKYIEVMPFGGATPAEINGNIANIFIESGKTISVNLQKLSFDLNIVNTATKGGKFNHTQEFSLYDTIVISYIPEDNFVITDWTINGKSLSTFNTSLNGNTISIDVTEEFLNAVNPNLNSDITLNSNINTMMNPSMLWGLIGGGVGIALAGALVVVLVVKSAKNKKEKAELERKINDMKRGFNAASELKDLTKKN